MKKNLILIVLPFLVACAGGSNKKATSLEDSLAKVNSELSEKDTVIHNEESALRAFVKSFNEIQNNLNQIKTKENILSLNTKNIELDKPAKDQIITDIQFIYNQMNKNKQTIAYMSKQLEESDITIDYLETAMANLNNQIKSKENEIFDLKNNLEKLNIDFGNLQEKNDNLEEMYKQEKNVSDSQTETLNTAYYAIGTTVDLKSKGIISKEGGFIGLGRVKELNKDLKNKNFTRIEIPMVTEIPLKNVEKVKLITPHPSGSYKIIQAGENNKLLIISPTKFWKDSKYLVVETEAAEE